MIAPAIGRLENCTICGTVAHRRDQGSKLLLAGQVPAFRTNATHGIGRRTRRNIAAFLAIFTPLAKAIHGRSPGVQATVFGTVGRVIVIAPTGGIGCIVIPFIENVCVSIVQILRHPSLGADGHRLIDFVIAAVGHGTRNYIIRINETNA